MPFTLSRGALPDGKPAAWAREDMPGIITIEVGIQSFQMRRALSIAEARELAQLLLEAADEAERLDER